MPSNYFPEEEFGVVDEVIITSGNGFADLFCFFCVSNVLVSKVGDLYEFSGVSDAEWGEFHISHPPVLKAFVDNLVDDRDVNFSAQFSTVQKKKILKIQKAFLLLGNSFSLCFCWPNNKLRNFCALLSFSNIGPEQTHKIQNGIMIFQKFEN